MVVAVESKTIWEEQALESLHETHDKARRVRQMFNEVAPTYELVNRVFSGGRDAYWRRKAVAMAAIEPDDVVLDVACGTGDFSRAFQQASPQMVIGCDFAHGMLLKARQHAEHSNGDVLHWCEADALRLPFRDETFTVATCAFGIRNFQNLDAGLSEFYRTLKPGGRAVILEFTRPANKLVRAAYELYSSKIMPLGATYISKDRTGAYRYLPKSVVSFPGAKEICDRLRRVGFERCDATPLTFGVVSVYKAFRPLRSQ